MPAPRIGCVNVRFVARPLYMFGQVWVLPWLGACVVVVPVLGVVVVPEFVEPELAAFAIAAPPPAMIPTVPSVTRAIRSLFTAFTSFRSLTLVKAKSPRLRRACGGVKSLPVTTPCLLCADFDATLERTLSAKRVGR